VTERSPARNGKAIVSVLAALALAGVVAEPAAALVVRAEASRVRSFSATGCGATDTETVPLPRGAGRILATRPAEGTRVFGRVTGMPVARLTGNDVVRSPGGDSVAFTATGSDHACSEPDPYAGHGWRTEPTELRVRFRRRVPVYMVGTDMRRRTRPRLIPIGASQIVYSLRWRSWGGRVARGRGLFPANDCVPDCASGQITNRPVTVRLGQPRLCDDGRYRYLVLHYRFRDSQGGGGRATFGYQC
jgi:hypothetical protein